jgi:hypothetical protein
MLTIKIRDNGIETVKEAKSVMFRPPRESTTGRSCITYFENDFHCTDVFWGDVYVMNENGKTVADYCLGHPESIPGGIDTDKVGYCKA